MTRYTLTPSAKPFRSTLTNYPDYSNGFHYSCKIRKLDSSFMKRYFSYGKGESSLKSQVKIKLNELNTNRQSYMQPSQDDASNLVVEEMESVAKEFRHIYPDVEVTIAM
ncbi:uncharacterized protein L201_005834 [Kwoniella dendrophila CBS 6074]|uniref:Uncharacterized protein n=1 Tax=Kwoniella dendrophila CBS 6074 TaxID=1295534 RepID=A0AAX4K1W9_9TREE